MNWWRAGKPDWMGIHSWDTKASGAVRIVFFGWNISRAYGKSVDLYIYRRLIYLASFVLQAMINDLSL